MDGAGDGADVDADVAVADGVAVTVTVVGASGRSEPQPASRTAAAAPEMSRGVVLMASVQGTRGATDPKFGGTGPSSPVGLAASVA